MLKLTSIEDDLSVQNDGTGVSQAERRHRQVPRLLGNRVEVVLLKSGGKRGKGENRKSQAFRAPVHTVGLLFEEKCKTGEWSVFCGLKRKDQRQEVMGLGLRRGR